VLPSKLLADAGSHRQLPSSTSVTEIKTLSFNKLALEIGSTFMYAMVSMRIITHQLPFSAL
jgi:hypothetical protein